jgi:ABC-type transport system involved in multi-copper enzyme maturation permease subunit
MSSSVHSDVSPRPGLARRLLHSEGLRLLLECCLLLALLAEGVGLLWLPASVGPGPRVLLWGQWLLLAAALAVSVGLTLFGPVFYFDLVRLTRRGRYFLIRVVYALALLFVLWVIWSNEAAYRGGELSASQMAAFASHFFFLFVAVQFGMVVLLTPAYVAGAIAEEKDRRTLEFVLATDLRDREIVLGKLGARLLNLLFVVLAGLPILALMQFLGGVDPGLLAAAFAGTALTMLGLAAVSILFSTLVRRSRDAIVLTYLAVPAYLLVGAVCYLLLQPPSWATFPSTDTWDSPFTLADAVEWFNAGNTVRALQRVFLAYGSPTLGDEVATVLGHYALFHGLLTLVCLAGAVLSVRRVALKEASDPPRKKGRGKGRRRLPPVGPRPVLWKELYVEAGVRMHWVGRIFVAVLVFASFLPLWLIYEDLERTSGQFLAEQINAWVRTVGTLVAVLMLVGVAVRAAGAVSGERERQTFDALLTSPLPTGDILYGKWLGSVLSMRWIWLWLGVIWLVGVLSGGLSPVAVPLLVGAWFAFAAFVAALGLWYSTVCPSTLRAVLWTLFTLVVLWGGHWLVWMCCIPLGIAAGPGGLGRELEEVLPRVAEFQAFTLTPPGTLAFLAFRLDDFKHLSDNYRHVDWGAEFLACSFLGMIGWSVAAFVLLSATVDRFNQVTKRVLVHGTRPRVGGGRQQAAGS